MSHWNNRVIQIPDGDEVWLAVHEVYYNEDGSPRGWTPEPIGVVGSNKEELLETLERMKHAINNSPVFVIKGDTLVELQETSDETRPHRPPIRNR